MKATFSILTVLIILCLGMFFLKGYTVGEKEGDSVLQNISSSLESSDSIVPSQNKIPEIQNQIHDPYATKGKGRKPKHDYICEVHLFDNSYQELKDLKDFKGDPTLVQRITIQRQGITELPNNIYDFKNIELLDISHNKLNTINIEKIKTFNKLKNLYLNGNEMTDEEINSIKNQFTNITIFNNEDVTK